MTWFTAEVEYEGFPLLLRRPDYNDIKSFKGIFTNLVVIQQLFETVVAGGLPEPDYNDTLLEFDRELCSLFKNRSNGLIFLIETFGGKRNYYFYTAPNFEIIPLVEEIATRHHVQLNVTVREDVEMNFVDDYPFKLYPK